jgi:tetratricopeptide (TPR) repeat protein
MHRHQDMRRLGLALFAAVALLGCATPTGNQRIDNLPMYGQPEVVRPEALRKADDEFITKATAEFGGNRKLASEAWAKEADDHMARSNLDFAMRRYNQSWLLNPENYKPYWGFGRIMLERDLFDESIKHFERAKELCKDNFQRVALLADTATAYAYKARSIVASDAEAQRLYRLANENFAEGTALDPSYASAWRRWAMVLYAQGDYADAWTKVKKAREMNAVPFSSAFLNSLEQKMPEPK